MAVRIQQGSQQDDGRAYQLKASTRCTSRETGTCLPYRLSGEESVALFPLGVLAQWGKATGDPRALPRTRCSRLEIGYIKVRVIPRETGIPGCVMQR